MKKLYAPIGYQMVNAEGEAVDFVDADNEEEIKEIATSMTADIKFNQHMAGATHEERLEFLTDNGHTIEEES